jgi:hypothetical protein
MSGGWAPAAGAASNLLPDLAMARPTNFTIDTSTISGHRLLRYSALIVNIGSGRFEIEGQRSSTTASMSVSQRIYNDAGGSSTISLPNATMFYAGDGHNHWHLANLESGTLTRLDNGSQVGSLAKHGFCFYDNVAHETSLPGAPQSPVYTDNGGSPGTAGDACDPNDPSALSVVAGLSVGWGDLYPYYIAFQYIDITNLQNGHYRLTDGVRATALGIEESSSSNDSTFADLDIKQHSVRLLAYGPAY